MGVDVRPAWMTPILYNDGGSEAPSREVTDDSPLDYGRRVDRDKAFDDEDDENDELYQEEES